MSKKEWENEDGSTNVEGFLKAYAEDDNTFWRAEQGHIQNVVDDLIDRNSDLEASLKEAREALWLKCPGEDAILIVPDGSDRRWLVEIKACHNHQIMTEGEFSRKVGELESQNKELLKEVERLRDWIIKSHHQDGCAARYTPYHQQEIKRKLCDCGKAEILNGSL